MPNPDVEKRAKELEFVYFGVERMIDDPFDVLAKHVEKLILEARINECQGTSVGITAKEKQDRIINLRTQLSALEEKK